MKSTVYLVMTVTMNRRKVDVPAVRAITIEMMTLDQVIRLEKESTGLAAPLLLFQQGCKALRHSWVLPTPCRPVSPVPIIRAGVTSHLRVSNNWHRSMLIEGGAGSIPERPAGAGCGVPVSTDGPPSTFARMPKECPSSELLIEPVVKQMKGLRAYHRPIIIGPARDHRVKEPNEVRLLGGLISADHLRELGPVAFNRFRAWLDERFEAASP